MDTEDHGFSFRLPADLSAALREQAKQHERSQGGEVRAIVRSVLTKDAAAAPEQEDQQT